MGSWGSLLMIAALFVMLYFFMIRPQKKQEKKDAEMRNALQVGDEVTTIGGIIGKVVSVKGETFVLETTKDKTKIRFLKGAIRSVDVKAADLAAAVMESAEESATDTVASEAETVKEETPAEIKARLKQEKLEAKEKKKQEKLEKKNDK